MPVYLDFERLGTVELDAFNQADIRIDKKWNFKSTSLNVFLEVQNAFAQEIPEPPTVGLDRNDSGEIIEPRQLVNIPVNNGEVLPTLGIVFDF